MATSLPAPDADGIIDVVIDVPAWLFGGATISFEYAADSPFANEN